MNRMKTPHVEPPWQYSFDGEVETIAADGALLQLLAQYGAMAHSDDAYLRVKGKENLKIAVTQIIERAAAAALERKRQVELATNNNKRGDEANARVLDRFQTWQSSTRTQLYGAGDMPLPSKERLRKYKIAKRPNRRERERLDKLAAADKLPAPLRK